MIHTPYSNFGSVIVFHATNAMTANITSAGKNLFN